MEDWGKGRGRPGEPERSGGPDRLAQDDVVSRCQGNSPEERRGKSGDIEAEVTLKRSDRCYERRDPDSAGIADEQTGERRPGNQGTVGRS